MRTTSFKPEAQRLFIDIETYSSEDLSKAGAFRYTEASDFEVLLLGYAYDDGEVIVMEFPNEEKDWEWRSILAKQLTNPDIVKVAHNCAFERTCLSKVLGVYLPPEQWEDTMHLAAMNGLPQSLDGAGAALGIEAQKLKEGTALISYFCKPCAPTKVNGGRTRNRPGDAPDKWERFKAYNKRDVEAEREIYKRLSGYQVTPFERSVFALDARINERGVLVDLDLARASVAVDGACRAKAEAEMKTLTGLENVNSVVQLRAWFEAVGLDLEAVNKATIAELLKAKVPSNVRRVCELRQLLGKTSTKKYEAMLNAACEDGRVRGLTQYYGAGRTGRWAGRLVQLQNLPQNHIDDIGTVRELVRAQDVDSLELCFDSVPDVLSQLIRTALIAKDGCTFLVADYSAIEARVIAYLAGEQWRMEAFAEGKDIYCASASQMFHVPVEKHGVNGHLRQKGKVAELACGYGGGVGALKAFGADKMGLSEEEMQDIVTNWRLASPTIPRFWRRVETAAKNALNNPGRAYSVPAGGYPRCLVFRRNKDALLLKLPSGRVLSYWGARLESDDYTGSIVFMGPNQTTKKWERIETWGGKLVENIVQAFSRDCLAVALVRLDEAGYNICFHVHDEIIAEAPKGAKWQNMAEIMSQPIDWAPGLLLRADGYETEFYMKD